ncbi:MAG: ribosome small subunit-dependent GTPase A [Peptoniphilaceae bacterium]|nr:ribosome small subunit-dependent GTPase A [Peptoniphilaceae bacterium]MDY6085587.1 ribosome small subunit-dependent GTPase A [Peptoniphilaceae bacterium]
MPIGHIISSEKDRYAIATAGAEGETIRYAKGRGVFREKDVRPMVGDYVEWVQEENALEGTITRVLPRKNALVRPPVANVDQVLVVQTLVEPEVNALQLDRLLAVLEIRAFPIVLCFNKIDRVDEGSLKAWVKRYALAGYPIFAINAVTGENVGPLGDALRGKVTAIAGPSGAGKSTLIRRLSGETSIAIGDLSKKTSRGRQTTRTSRLFTIGPASYIFDTPGFSSLDLRDFSTPDSLALAFPEIRRLVGQCRFRDCTHRKEPDCAVKRAVEAGEMDAVRYASYRTLYQMIEEAHTY